MKYRTLGRTGLIVSEVSLGTMQFGKNKVGNLDQEATTRMVRFAIDHGINLIDTADIYTRGESETLLGNALKGIRDEVVVATKVRLPMSDNFNRAGATRVNMMRGIESSLKRLQTDHVDLYQVHSWDTSTPLEETLRTFDDLVRQGKTRYIGFSNYMAWQGAKAIDMQERLGLEKYVTAQMYYSLVGRGVENEFLDFAAEYGIGILVWSPLAGGFLSGKYPRGNAAPAGTRFSEAGVFVPLDPDQAWRVIDALKDVAGRHGATPSRVALAWLLSRTAISSVIIEARTLEHLEDDMKSVDLALTPEDLSQLDAVSDTGIPYPRWMVLQHDAVEDPRRRILHPELYEHGGPWHNLSREWKG
jgi:aryl-alcohol dehydrogenase-like predicted oxidoreductase